MRTVTSEVRWCRTISTVADDRTAATDNRVKGQQHDAAAVAASYWPAAIAKPAGATGAAHDQTCVFIMEVVSSRSNLGFQCCVARKSWLLGIGESSVCSSETARAATGVGTASATT